MAKRELTADRLRELRESFDRTSQFIARVVNAARQNQTGKAS